MATNRNELKVYVRLDGQNRLIAGSTVRRRSMPKNGHWLQLPSSLCCDNLTICDTTTTP